MSTVRLGFWSAAAGVALGIWWRSFFAWGWAAPAALALLALVLGAYYWWQRDKIFIPAALLCLGAALGLVRYEASLPAMPSVALGEPVVLTGRVVAEPDRREQVQYLVVEPRGWEARVRVTVPLDTTFYYRDEVEVKGELARPENFFTDTGRVFDYVNYLAKDGVLFQIFQPDIRRLAPAPPTVIGGLLALKRWWQAGVNRLVPEPASSLAGGLVVGAKAGLSDEVQSDFRRSGLVHIVVLSGFNLMIVARAALVLTGRLPGLWSGGLAALVVLLFTLMAGANPPAVRAALMALIALGAHASGRQYSVAIALAGAALVMMLWNPLILVHDPSFQLSVLATLGLIYPTPIVEARLTWLRPAWLREVVATTVGAQLAVLPWLLALMGQLSLVALPANIIALPVVPLAMALAAATGLLAWLPGVGWLLGLASWVVLSYIIEIAHLAAAVPGAAVNIAHFPWWAVLASYAALGILVLYGRIKV